MRSRLHQLSYARVTATLALFLALGTGGAYAAETIGSSDIINESILSQDIKNGEVKAGDIGLNAVFGNRISDGTIHSPDIALNSIPGSRVLNNTLTGDDINESTLGKVGDADTLDGKDLSELEGPRAYGRLDPQTCNIDDVCSISEAKNVANIRRLTSGRYCIKVDGLDPGNGLDSDTIPLVATVDFDRTAAPQGNASVMTFEEGICLADEFVVYTMRQPQVAVQAAGGGTTSVAGNAQLAGDIAFSFIVP